MWSPPPEPTGRPPSPLPRLTAAFCQTNGSGCDATATSSLSTDGAGVLSGTVDVPASPTLGARALKVTNGARSALFPITLLGTRTVSLSPASGGLGTVVSVTASQFDPTAAVTIQGLRNIVGPVVSTDAPCQRDASARAGALAATELHGERRAHHDDPGLRGCPGRRPRHRPGRPPPTRPLTGAASITSISGQRSRRHRIRPQRRRHRR